MSESADKIMQAIHTIESEIAIIKRAMADLGVKEEGVVGIFDGEYIQLDNGRKYPIPPNYASKSMLVPGDTLRMIEDPQGGDQHRFKQIAKVERGKAVGLLTRKDGKFEVICEEGSFKVLTAAAKHFEVEAGDSVAIQFAKNHPKGSWAAIEKVASATGGQTAGPSQPLMAATTISHLHQEATVDTTTDGMSRQPASQEASIALPPKSAQPANHSSKTGKERSKSKSGGQQARSKSKSQSRPSEKSNRPAQPAPSEVKPMETSLPVQQGEITLPTVMDEDDLT